MAYPETEFEAEWETEFEGEAARRGGPPKPSSKPSFKPRPTQATPMYVTQPQLEAALTRVDGKIKTVSEGVSTINSRLASLAAAAKKEAEERKKTTESQGKDLNQKLMMLAILPALVQPTFNIPAQNITLTAAQTGGTGAITTAVTIPGQSNISSTSTALTAMLPVLAIAGTGTDGGFGSDNSTMMMMALAVALSH
jgi:hypothetical protein